MDSSLKELCFAKSFNNLFGWKDSVVNLPFGAANIDEIMRELDNDPNRQNEIRKNNVKHCLAEHDWLFRWEEVLNTAGMPHTKKMKERKELLNKLSEKFL